MTINTKGFFDWFSSPKDIKQENREKKLNDKKNVENEQKDVDKVVKEFEEAEKEFIAYDNDKVDLNSEKGEVKLSNAEGKEGSKLYGKVTYDPTTKKAKYTNITVNKPSNGLFDPGKMYTYEKYTLEDGGTVYKRNNGPQGYGNGIETIRVDKNGKLVDRSYDFPPLPPPPLSFK